MTTPLIYDIVLRNGTVIDGSGAPRYMADVAINGDRITAIRSPGTLKGRQTINIEGLVVSPGFIDVHTHDDRLVLIDPSMQPKVSQGIATVVVGNCGISLSPLKLSTSDPVPPLNLLGSKQDFVFDSMRDYIKAVNQAVPAVNVVALVGHSTLRVAVMDELDRPASAEETQQMRSILHQALAEGAAGLSSGLYYQPANAAEMDELVELAKEASHAGGIYTTHMRDEDDFVMESLQETFETGRRAEVPVVISHHKCAGRKNWGRSVDTLRVIEQAAATQAIHVDAYPYSACSTVLRADAIDESIRIIITWSTPCPEVAGRDLSDIAAEWQISQHEACERLSPAGAVYFDMSEDDVQRILAHPLVMIGSDGIPHDSHPHPRLWGTFPRVLGHYSRDIGLFSLEEAVRKMTSLPAQRFGLAQRGAIATDHFADLVVFDPATISDAATFEQPIAPAVGVTLLLVNGQVAYSTRPDLASRRNGRFLTRAGMSTPLPT